ncbi:MAG: Calx-beta domain-containing protein [Fuerstiella sp.]
MRTSRKPRRSQASQVSGHRSDVRPLESLEDRLLLTFVAPDEVLGIFADQGAAGTDGGTFLQVDTTDANNRIAGGVEEVLAHPTDPNILYAASVNGGIWKTTNGASANPTWVVQTDNLLDAGGNPVNQGLSFGAISFDLTDRVDSTPFQTLVAATALSSSYSTDADPEGGISGQVFVTFDGGDTWTNPGSAGLEGQNIIGVEIEFDRDTGQHVIVAASSEGSAGNPGGGLFRSVDGGATFTPITTVLNGADFATDGSTNALALVADATVANPADAQSGRLYAATSDTSSGLYRSDDFGDTWSRIDSAGSDIRTVITDGLTNAVELSVHPTTGRLYVGVLHDGQLGGSLTSATGVGGIFYASDADQNAPTWITMDNPWAPVNITDITNWQNTNDQAGAPGVEPPNGVGPVRITAPGHQLLSGDIVLIRNAANNIFANGAVNQRWVVTFIDNNTISLQGRGGLTVDVTGGQIMRIETAVGGTTTLAEGDPQGQLHFSLTTDPGNHNVVYFGLSELDVSNEIGGTATHASLWRGDVTQSAVSANAPTLINSRTVSSQWESLVGDSTPESPQSGTANSTEPHRGSRSITFDAGGNLLESSDGGVFRRTSPLDNTGDWTSLAGNLGNSEFLSVAYDTVSNAIVAGSVDNGTQQALVTDDGQPDSFQVALGSTVTPEALIPAFGLRIKEGLAGGSGADVAVGQLDNGNSIRYYSHTSLGNFTTAEHDAAGNLVATQTRNLQVTDGSNLMAQRETPLAVNALFGDHILFGAENGVYESFNSGDTIDNASLGQAIQATPNSAGSVAYGGRSSNDYGDNPFIIYAGAVDGNIWVRNQSAGAFASSALSANSILDVEINPGEWTEAFAVSDNSVHRININADADPIASADITTTDITGNLLSLLPAGSEIFSLEFINGTGQGVEGIVVGTSTGVYATTMRDLDAGRNFWFNFGTALPDVQIRDMDYDSADDVLILGTLGRGTWKLDDASLFLTPKISLTVAAIDPSDPTNVAADGASGNPIDIFEAVGTDLSQPNAARVTATLSRPLAPGVGVSIRLGSSGAAQFTEPGGTAGVGVNSDDYLRSADIGADGSDTVITIAPGTLSGTAEFTAIDDNFAEDTELIQVTASIEGAAEAEILQSFDTATYTGVGGALADADIVGPASTDYTLNIADVGQITDLDLTLTLVHPEVSELSATLTSPSGVVINLFSVLTAGANLTGTIFDDEAVTNIGNALAPFTGRFRATDSLSLFDGEELSGDWILTITDSSEGNLGSLTEWQITANRATDATELPQISIIDDDDAPLVSLAVSPSALNEDLEETATITATIDAASGQEIIVTLGIDGALTTAEPGDYTASPFTLTIPAGSTTATATVQSVIDLVDEDDEVLVVNIDSVTNAIEDADQSVAITIIDDDLAPNLTLTVSPDTITEDTSETAIITAHLDAASEKDVEVTLLTAGGTAGVADFTTTSLTFTIPAGSTTGTMELTASPDLLDEFAETVEVTVGAITNATEVGSQQVIVTIIDDDPEPNVTLSVTPATISEDLNEVAVLTVALDAVSEKDVEVTIEVDTGASTAESSDYTIDTLTVTIPAGTTTATIQLQSETDLIDEFDETVVVDIASIINGVESGTQRATVTITDDDPLPTVTLSVLPSSILEDANETATITATLSAATEKPVQITLEIDASSTAEPGDYTATPLVITVPAGSTTATLDITSVTDVLDEFDETVVVNIDSVIEGIEAGQQSVTVTIIDDEALPNVSLSVDTTSITEDPNQSAIITATLDAVSEKDVTVTLVIDDANDSAEAADYTTTPLTITILAGATTGTMTLTSATDDVDEFDETVKIDIDSVVNALESGDQTVTVTITDDDPLPNVSLSVDTTSITEDPNQSAIITATLDAVSQKDVTVTLVIDDANDSAEAADYTNTSLTITILAGATTGTMTLTSATDDVDEFDETVKIDIDSVVNALEAGDQTVTVTITDEDPLPNVTLSVDTTSITEDPNQSAIITATLDAVSQKDVTVTLVIDDANDSAEAADYTTTPLTITILAGETTGTMTLTSATDNVDEFDETVKIDIDSVVNALEAGEQTVTVTITDDDPLPLVTLSADRTGIREIPSEVSTVTASLSEVSQKPVTVQLVINAGSTASNVLDYSLSPTTLVVTIPAGGLSASISVTALPDALREFDETVIVEIDTVLNAQEDGEQEVVITIVDERPEADEVVGIFEEHGGAAVINGQTQSADPDRRVTGAIEDVLTHPTNADIIYVGSINGGIWKTENATSANPTWVPQTDSLESLSIGAIEFDLDDPTSQSLVAGTGRFSSFGSAGGQQGRVYVTDDGGNTWESPGSVGLEGENISGIARKGDVIVVTSSEGAGGLFRSTDRGATFTAIDSPGNFVSNGSINFFDLVSDPTTENRLYAAAEDTGIFRSDDFGLTWNRITGIALGLGDNDELNTDITNNSNNNLEMAIQPLTGRLYLGVVIAGRVGGIYYTSDGDTDFPTWTAMDVPRLPAGAAIPVTGAAGGPIQITAVAHGLATNDNVVVRNVDGNTAANGYWRITVTGPDTFTLVGSASNGTYVANTGEVVPVTSPSPGFKDIDETGSQGRIHFSITAHPTDPNLVYIGGDRQEQPNVIGDGVFGGSVFRGDASIPRDDTGIPSPQWDHATNNPTAFDLDGGTASNSGPHADSRDMAFDANGELIQVDDGGIFRRTSPEDNTGDWFSLAGNLGTVEYHSIAYDTISDLILGGTQDNGTHVQTSPDSNTFRMFNGGDGGDIVVDSISLAASGQSIRYFSSQFLGGFRRAIVNADGSTASTQGINLTPTTSGIAIDPQFYTPIALNNLFPTQIIIGGANGIFESFNQGDSVDLAGAGIRATGSAAGPLDYGGRSAVNGDNRAVIYAGDGTGRVHVRTESNGAFVASPDFGGAIRDVEMDPSEWMTAFAVNGTSVQMTTDAGATWTNITNNLFGVGAGEIHSIQYIDGGATGVEGIVVGTDRGTFATTLNQTGTNRPVDWFRFGSGLPDVQIRDMAYDAEDDVLILGTLGRGSWCLKDASQFLLPNVVLSTDTLFVNEDGSQVATVTARISRVNAEDILIALDSNGTATFTEPDGTTAPGTGPDDYVRDTLDPADGSAAADPVNYIRIPAGELFGFATFTPVDDAIYEDDEVIEIEATIVTDAGDLPEAQLYLRNAAFTETLTYAESPNTVIADVSTESFTISVADVGVVNDITVNLGFLNDETFDLTAVLTGPDGTTVTLFDQDGPTFADSILDAFDGRPSAGDWVLTLTDNALIGVATLEDWSITVDRTVESTTLPSITIIDDEEAPFVLLSTDELTLNEDGTDPFVANLNVRLVDSMGNTVVTERPVTVNLTVDALSTATGADDYTLAATTLVIDGQPGAGVSSATTTLTAEDDSIFEFTENVIIDINTVTDGIEDGDQQVIVEIVDNEVTPSIRIVTDVDTVNEAGTAPVQAVVTIELFDPLTGNLVEAERPITADLVINGAGTATLTDDYTLDAVSLTIAADAFTALSSASTTITAVDDPHYELPETVVVDLMNVAGANVDGNDADTDADGAQQVTVTINDDEAVPSIRLVTDVTSINEDQSAPFEAVLTLELFDPITGNLVLAERPVDATLAIDAASTATELADYTLADIALQISGTPGSGLATASTTLTALPDAIYELPEDVIVNIATVLNANIDGADANALADGPQSVTVTIVDDEATPSIRLLVDQLSINEDGSAPGVATVTAELFDPVTGNTVLAERPVTVDLLTSGDATDGNDYVLALSSLLIDGSFTSAVSSTTTTITASQDDFYELPETVIVDLDNADQANIGTPAQITVTIQDDEATPSIRLLVDETTINEDGSVPGAAILTAELFDPSTGNTVFAERPVTVDLLTSGTATDGDDYALALTTLLLNGTFGAAVSSTTTTVTASQDDFYELPETVIVDLDNADQANIGAPAQITITIQDDEATPSIRLLVDETTINEDGSAPGTATVTAELFDAATGNTVFAERPVTVDLLTSGTATSGNDYNLALSSLLIGGSFGAPVASTSTTVAAEQDAFYELPETVILDLNNADQAVIGAANQVTITIADDEVVPSIRLVTDELLIDEDGSGTSVATISIELFDPITGDLVFAERPVNATIAVDLASTATNGSDYDLASTALSINGTFGAGVNSASTTVTARQDAIYELPETVIVGITGVSDAVVDGADADTDPDGPQQLTVTIVDDEAAPEVQLFLVTSAIDSTLVSNVDRFEFPGQRAIVVATLVDAITGLPVQSERPIVVDLEVDPASTATQNADFFLFSSQIIINGSEGSPVTQATTQLQLLDDLIFEFDEEATVRISNADFADIGTPSSVTMTIIDGEATPSVRLLVDNSTIDESTAPTVATVTAELFNPATGAVVQAERPVVVDLSIAASSLATEGNDYVIASKTLTIDGLPGVIATAESTTITAIDDAVYELSETINVDIQSVTDGIEAGIQRVTVTITDNEVTPSVRLVANPLSINEDGSAPSTADVTVEVFDPLTGDLVVAERPIFVTLVVDPASTADEGDDYTLDSQSLTINGQANAGLSTATTTITAIDDITFELDETVIVAIESAIDANIDGADADADPDGPQQVTVTIVEDDIAPTITLDLSSATTLEDGGITVVTATLSHPVQAGAIVDIGVSGTATSGTDYLISSLSIAVAANELSGSVNIAAIQDTLDEPDETIIVDVVGATNATEGTEQQQTLTILDDDDPVNVLLTIDQTEIAEGGGTAIITATLTDPNTAVVAPSGFEVTVNLVLTGTATTGLDYTLPTTITIPIGATSASITLEGLVDNLDEVDETVIASIDSIDNGVQLNPQQVTATLIDADVLPEITLEALPTVIAETGGSATFTLTLDAVSGKEVVVDLNLGGSATGGGIDYDNPPLQVTIPIGETVATFDIAAVADLLNEIDETIVVSISSLTNAVAGGAQQQTVTITDDDAVPTVSLSIDETSILEDAGSALLTATLSAVSGRDIIVDLGFSGTADRTDDYIVPAQILIPAGQISATAQLNAIRDLKDEFDEQAVIDVANVTNATEDGVQSVNLTIVDSDVEPTVTLSASADTVREDAGTVTFFATLDTVSGKDITVNLELLGEAIAGVDYTAGPVTVQIPAGQLQASVELSLIEDGIDEFDELATIQFVSVVNAVENIVQQASTLIEDTDAPPLVSIAAGALDLIEQNEDSSVITISLSEASAKPVTVALNFGGTATAIQDYTGRVGSVLIPEGETSATFVLTATDDDLDETNETIEVTIASIVNADENGSQLATVTIIDDEDLPEISIVASAMGILEDSETGTFTLQLSEPAGRDIDVALLIGGDAIADNDYTALPTMVTIPEGTTSFPIALNPIADALAENDEDVTVTIDATNTPLATTVAGSDVATIAILNDEALPTVSISSNVTTIGEGGGDAILTLTLSEASGRDVTVDLDTSGLATEDSDYAALTDQVIIPAGTLSLDLLLTSIDDAIDEFDEDAVITISAVSFADIGTASATVVIVDNDPDPLVSMTAGDLSIAEEGGVSTITVSLDAASEKPVTVHIAPTGTATSDVDYVAVATSVTIPAGETSVTFDVTAISDNEVESQETVILAVASVDNAVFDGITATVSIVDDDVPTLFVSLADAAVNEADGAAATMVTVTRNASLSVPMIVTLTSSDTGEATVPMTLSFEAGSESITVPVTAVNDFILDGSQTVTFTAAAAGFIDGTADLDVEDATTSVNLSVDVVEGTEEDQTVITITATTDKPVIGAQTLDLVVNGTNITASDYLLAASTLTFADGETSATTTFTIQDDNLVEAMLETATISIAASTDGLASGPIDSVDVAITDNDQATLAISDVTVTEADSGTLNAVLNVTLTGTTDAGFTVDFSTLADTATAADSDYSATTGQLTFAGTDAEVQTISIAINGDEKVELDEAFFVNLANVVANTRNVAITDDRGTVTITNDDSASVTIADTSIEESDNGTQILTFTATLDQIVDVPVTLDWATADLTALVSDIDYLSASGQVTFTPSTTAGQQATFSIAVVGDEKVELDETLQAVLSNLTASGRDVTIADSTAIATIINDDQAAFTIDDVTVVEGDAGVQTMTFTITLDEDVDTPIELDVDTRNVTATFNEDYQPNTGSILAFTGVKGETKTFDVIAFGDTKVEQDEIFQVLLSNIAAAGRNVVIGDGTGEGTILNDDSAEISVTGGTVTEGDSGTTNITFTITLDQTVATPISIDFATTANSASATDNDYEAESGTLNFAANVAGSQSQTVTVVVNGDTKVELDEIFTLDLSNPEFAGLNITNSVSQAVGRILNDDSATISIADLTLDEGDDSATLFGFEVSIDAEIDTDITLLLNTQDGTATVVDADYVGQTDTTVTLLANTGGPQTAVVNVDVTGDEVVERTETFFAQLSGLNTSGRAVTVADDSATGTITNDDSATVSVDNITVMEGDTGTTEVSFTITLDAEIDNAVSVNYATEDQSATVADGDYVDGVAGTLTFAADVGGAQSQTVTVGITGDEKVELNEAFLLNLSNLISGERLVSIGNGSGVATIANDDSAAITVTTVSQNEGNDGPNNFTFEATLTNEIDTPITFRFDAVDGTATIADGDFAASGGTVTFAANAGAGPQTVGFNVSVEGDVRVELDETFDVALSNFQNEGRSVSLDTTVLTATVINDDSAEVTVSDATIVEGTNGITQLVFNVTLDAEVQSDVSINYRTGNSGTAIGGLDYTPVSGTLTFPGGQGTGAQTLTVSVPVTSDSIVELDETLVLELSNLVTTDANVSVANDLAVGTIVDDDVATISVASASAVEGTATGDEIIFTFTLDRFVDTGISFNYGFLTGAINEAGVASLSDLAVPATTFLSFTGTAGEQRQVIVPLTADNIVEQNETFEVTISDIIAGGRNVVASDTNGIGTIVNDDSAVVTVQDIDVVEGDAGTTQAVFTLGVSQPVQNAISIDYATADGTASSTAGDYESTSGTATLSSGTATVSVTINPDTVVEGDETFFLNLSGLATAGQSVTLPDTQAVGTIVNDDLVNLTISDATVREGFGATQATLDFVVTRDNASVPVVFEVTTSNGTASDGDYTGVVRRISLPADGELVSTVSINVTGDHLQEADETIVATLTSQTPGANIANPTATGTIVNDDGTLSGLKFHDVNDNGQRDDGEPGLQGWTIQVLDDDGNVLTSTVTGSDGTYRTGVNEGTWNVQEVLQAGWRQSFPGATNALAFQLDQELDIRFTGNGFFNWGGLNEKWFFTNEGWHFLTPAGNFFKWDNSPRTNLTGDFVAALGQRYHEVPSLLFDAQPTVDRPITIVAGEETADIDFGNVPTGRIEGRKFHDVDADGVRDANEPYLNGWSVFLTDSNGQVVGTAVTSDLDLNGDGSIDPSTERGWYRFDNLLPDTYVVSEEDRTGWSQNGADGAFAALAFELDQQLDFGQPANDFFNWGGLNERWIFSTTAGWHFITPEGQLFRWNNSPRNNLSGIPVATLDSTYWQDLSLLYNAEQPNQYQIQVEGQQVSEINFANTFGHDGTGTGNVAVALVGSRLQITGDSGNNTVVVYTDEALNRTIITTVGSTLNGSTDPFVIDSTTLSGPIDVQLGNGNDQFALLDSNLTSALSIDSGIGNDRISLSQITSTAPVSLTNPSGTDQSRILRSELTGVTFSGPGSAAILDSTLSGNLTSTSAGQSRLAVARSSVDGTANVTGSALSDRFLMFQADINRLNISGAAGNDVLALIESSFDTALVANLDAGNDSFALQGRNTFGSASSLDGAANTDRIATDGNSVAIQTSNVETNANSELDSLIDIALSSFDDLLLDL